MRPYPVDLEAGSGEEEAVVVLSDGTRKPLSEWMRRRLDGRVEASPGERDGAGIR